MEVYTSRLIPELVIHVDDDGVADVRLQQGTWPCSIDTNDRSRVSIWGSVHPRDVPVDFNSGGAREADPTQEQKKNVRRIHHSRVDASNHERQMGSLATDELLAQWRRLRKYQKDTDR